MGHPPSLFLKDVIVMRQVSKLMALLGAGLFYIGIGLFVVEWFERPGFVVPFLTMGGLSVLIIAVFLQESGFGEK
ncbi:hypothetical protein GCM10010954_21120 [Halobacillus andaensis]|uniref:Uncharacterized protein n=2 Tax=Halobacillus andaensis TaxID=1176239 RepID=A0A917B435_HALAA|nr:hypothetical protein GCM10010954_21120 [Halobacillus andaensis]